MSELRIVKGNTFWTKTTVTAKDYEGTVIDDFDLSQSTDVVVIIRTAYRNIVMTEWSITGNDLEIKWKDIPTGRYGLDVSGIYDGIEWRFYTENVLDIVNSNAQANIPDDTIIKEDFYAIDGVTMMVTQVIGGGGNVQSDWEEEDSTNAAYIKNKPTIPSIEGLITQEAADARYAQISDIPTNVSQLTNDAGYLTSHQSLEGYATEQWVDNQGYLTEHQSLEGYATETWVGRQGYLTSFTETDPTVPSWAKQTNKPNYTAEEVGALPSSTPIPSALSDLSDDATHRVVTDTEKATWNGKSDFSGSYNDLTDKPTIPTVPTNVSAFTNDAGYLTQHQSLSGYATEQWVGQQGYLTEHQDISGKADKVTVVDHDTSNTTFALTPNVFHKWGVVSSLTLTLASGAVGYLSEYMFEFQSGSTATSLSLPSTVTWVNTPTIKANKTYQVSIVDNIAIIVGV